MYSSQEWMHVYTDGSQKSEACGAGFFSSVAQGTIAVGKFASNVDGEVAAISEAAKVMLPLPGIDKSGLSLGLDLGNAGHRFTHHPREARHFDRAQFYHYSFYLQQMEEGICWTAVLYFKTLSDNPFQYLLLLDPYDLFGHAI
ncbi:hypothetical protein CDAR_407571 [Caerostris darwini]|uniref:RNase H type-1 domain-containing protein n=1 Tax=Caerostris darwini TaxID=1538125 RepID=A0AAV4Q377_9ARAC|nr:hypothetical protein CDAR_407571 [Caerostris darwini]